MDIVKEYENTPSIKTIKLPAGTVLTVAGDKPIIEGEPIKTATGERPNHSIEYNAEGVGLIRIPLGEALRMVTKEGKTMKQLCGDSAEFTPLAKFAIEVSTDRKDKRSGNLVYPLSAYKNAFKVLTDGMPYAEFMASELSKDRYDMDPVQDYTIAEK